VTEIPNNDSYRLINVVIPRCVLEGISIEADEFGLCCTDLTVSDGNITTITAAGVNSPPTTPIVDRQHTLALPCFVDMHTHLDKAHLCSRIANPNGTFEGAIDACHHDQAVNWTHSDVFRRMDFALRSAYAHGTRAIRTHLDANATTNKFVWSAFAALKDKWDEKIELQAVSLSSLDSVDDSSVFRATCDLVEEHQALLGAVVYFDDDLARRLRMLFEKAQSLCVDVDLHVDETLMREADSLTTIAETLIDVQFTGRVTVGHCCSLSTHSPQQIERTLDRMAEANLSVVSLPMCNLYLQDRSDGRTPRLRGVTPVHEMRARGIPVAFASDNTRDPFYAYGDQDMLEVLREATRISHLDHPVASWPASVSRVPADIMRLADRGRIMPGSAADLVMFSARNYSELYSRTQSDRVVLRDGQAIDTTLPDFRELD